MCLYTVPILNPYRGVVPAFVPYMDSSRMEPYIRSSGLLSCGLFKISRVDYYPLCGLCTTLLWALQDTSRVDYTPVDYSPVWALHHTLLWAPVGSPVDSLLCAAKLLCSGAKLLCSGAKLFCSGAGHLSLGVLANSFHAYPATGALRLATHDMYSNDARGNLVTCPLRTLWCFSSARQRSASRSQTPT